MEKSGEERKSPRKLRVSENWEFGGVQKHP
jgi:hypothetical protein